MAVSIEAADDKKDLHLPLGTGTIWSASKRADLPR
jgi:hypothetical protein